MKRWLAVAVLLFVPSVVKAQGLGEVFQGITDPHIVGGAAYNQDTKTWAAVLTANIVGPKVGTLPVYLSGVGVSIGTIAPGLENTSFAAASFPIVTIAPFGEQVVFQAGVSVPLNGNGGKSYYGGVGLSLGGGPNQLAAKRARRAAAKKAKKALEQGPPAPAVS